MSRILPASVRGQAVLGAVVIVTLFGLLTGVASYLLVTQAARASETEIVSARIDDVVEQLGEAGGAGTDELDVGVVAQPNPVYVQVVTSAGEVVAASPGLADGARHGRGARPLSRRRRARRIDLGRTRHRLREG